MNTPTRDNTPDEAATEPRSWLTAEIEGRTVRFWILVGLLIAVVTLGFGAWWVWGLDRGTPMGQAGDDMAEMQEMPSTDVRLPAVSGFYAGEEVFFVHPEVSDPDVAGMLTDMMDGSPVLVVPELADVPPGHSRTSTCSPTGSKGWARSASSPTYSPPLPATTTTRRCGRSR